MRKNKTKQKLLSGEVAIGSFISLDSPDLVEIFGIAGFDFVVLDNEHTPGNPYSVQHMLRAAELSGMDTIIRIPNGEQHTILKALDIGASGIKIPQVSDVETVKRAVHWSHYFPEGMRGFAAPRALNYGLGNSLLEESSESNEEVLLICQCETVESFSKLDEIAAVPGLDVVFIGPYDMSQSLGIPGQINHPNVLRVIRESIEIIRKHGKIGGIFCGTHEDVQERISLGYQYIAYSIDSGIIGNYLVNTVKQLKAIK
ncbi:MAG: aldolase/citrate lyase family protein [Synergistaceae bacterium]|nr:aldolase/citrate lyase family protein [Synergistaceae bacterium]